MRCKFFILLTLLLLINCKKKEFEEFDFSYGNTFETEFSIKFNPENDSVFIREHWSPNNGKAPLSKTNYVSKINELQKNKLDSFLNNINFKAFDTVYFENYSDGEYYSFFVKRNGFSKNIKVHSHTAPKALSDFATWIYQIKKSLKIVESQREFNFKSKFPAPEPPKAPK